MNKQEKKDYVDGYESNFVNSKFGTKAIHSGQEPDIVNGCMAVPIFLASTYKQHSPANPFGDFDYSRVSNPTRQNLERLIASLEGGKYALAMSSGCACTSAIINMIKSGEHVICIDDVYGGTQRIFRKIMSLNYNIDFSFVQMDDMEDVKKELNPKTRLVWVESPTNPTLKVTDINALVKLVKEYNKDIIIVVDNTFLSPYNYRPLEHGADIAYESATKYLGGHSDLVMGVVSTNSAEIHEKLAFILKTNGACPSPFDSYMLIRGIKTLHLRVERINFNALKIAQYLESHPKIEKVNYSGLESSKYYEVAKKNGYKGHGGIVSFYLKANKEESIQFFKNCKVFTLAESLGAVESLIEHPASMTHASIPKELREKSGVLDSLLRLSVGIEDESDLIEDLRQAIG